MPFANAEDNCSNATAFLVPIWYKVLCATVHDGKKMLNCCFRDKNECMHRTAPYLVVFECGGESTVLYLYLYLYLYLKLYLNPDLSYEREGAV